MISLCQQEEIAILWWVRDCPSLTLLGGDFAITAIRAIMPSKFGVCQKMGPIFLTIFKKVANFFEDFQK